MASHVTASSLDGSMLPQALDVGSNSVRQRSGKEDGRHDRDRDRSLGLSMLFNMVSAKDLTSLVPLPPDVPKLC